MNESVGFVEYRLSSLTSAQYLTISHSLNIFTVQTCAVAVKRDVYGTCVVTRYIGCVMYLYIFLLCKAIFLIELAGVENIISI